MQRCMKGNLFTITAYASDFVPVTSIINCNSFYNVNLKTGIALLAPWSGIAAG
jgi:hypothetical protein